MNHVYYSIHQTCKCRENLSQFAGVSQKFAVRLQGHARPPHPPPRFAPAYTPIYVTHGACAATVKPMQQELVCAMSDETQIALSSLQYV